MSQGIRPLFSYYGGKYLAGLRYPAPRHDTLIEPFAGSAGYSLRHYQRRVVLVDASEYVVGVWSYLIKTSAAEIAALPDLEPGQKINDLAIPQEARWLIGFWSNQAGTAPRQSMSAWGRGLKAKHYWGPHVRARVAANVDKIRHWAVFHADYTDIPNGAATWFIDPPYQVAGKYYPKQVSDYAALATWCQERQGQVIVCEQEGANWLPFREFGNLRSAHKKGARSKEAYWLSDWDRQSTLPEISLS